MKTQKTTRSLKLDVICVLTSLILSGLLGIASVSIAVEGAWTKKGDMPNPRYGLSSSVVNGKIYVIGGGGGKGSTVEEYDPATDTWTTKARMPTGREWHSAGVVNGKIYVIGGSGSPSTVEEYDPAADTWTKKANKAIGRRWHSASVVNDKIYAIGGSGAVSTVEEYDPATDTWTKKANMPTGRSLLATSAVNGKIYAIGGWLTTFGPWTPSSAVEEYDPATDKWTKKADMPTARAGLSACVLNGKIYTIAGAIGVGNADTTIKLTTVEVYDPATDTWTEKADMLFARYGFSTSVVDGRIYAIGGSLKTRFGIFVPTVEEYTPEGWPFAVSPVSPQGKLAATWGNVKRGR